MRKGEPKILRQYQDRVSETIKSLERRGLIEFSPDGQTVKITAAGRILACAEQIVEHE